MKGFTHLSGSGLLSGFRLPFLTNIINIYFRPKPILHRDLKSRNVFLKNNQIKVGDLGVSRVLAESFANTFLGTPFYMSPEMIKDSKYDAKADIWSLGCIVFELIMLRRAYQCDSLMRLLWKIVEDDAPRISDGMI